jgi:hypothetical protein
LNRQIGYGLRWAAGLGLGVGLMLGAAFYILWQSPGTAGTEAREQEDRPGAAQGTGPSGSQAAAARTVAFSVLPGMTFLDIADLLEAAGAIADREAFLARAEELDALHRAQPGLYVITQEDSAEPASYDEIIAQLVGGQSP